MERDFGIEEVQVARVLFRLAGNVVFVASLVNLIGHLLQSKREEISQSVIVSDSNSYDLMLFFDWGLCKDDGSGDSILHHLGHHLLHYGGQGLGDRHIWNHHVMVHLSQNQYSANSSAAPEIFLSN